VLNVRDWSGRNPTRVVIDRFLRLSEKLHLFDGSQRTICYNLLKHEEHPGISLMRLAEENFIPLLVQDLVKQKIHSVLVEGGAQTLQLFISHQLWDEARVFQSPRLFENGISAPTLPGKIVSVSPIGVDRLTIFRPH
jgi:diaminohydroxyphosphoribosylaminopyrimidine deaminase/5-amino-6-(5-phosphoribosylamino)uracil reductase